MASLTSSDIRGKIPHVWLVEIVRAAASRGERGVAPPIEAIEHAPPTRPAVARFVPLLSHAVRRQRNPRDAVEQHTLRRCAPPLHHHVTLRIDAASEVQHDAGPNPELGPFSHGGLPYVEAHALAITRSAPMLFQPAPVIDARDLVDAERAPRRVGHRPVAHQEIELAMLSGRARRVERRLRARSTGDETQRRKAPTQSRSHQAPVS
jgi:hypothetical protein